MILRKVISGGQTGVDTAALRAAKSLGIATGGFMPLGWKTLEGPKPEYAQEFGMTQAKTSSYRERTFRNVELADGTLRIARDFNSPGERCTANAIREYRKPYKDKPWNNTGMVSGQHIVDWIIDNNIEVLNVAGNSEDTAPGIEPWTEGYLTAVFQHVQHRINAGAR